MSLEGGDLSGDDVRRMEHLPDLVEAPRSSRRSGGGRLLLELQDAIAPRAGVFVWEAPASALAGVGLELSGGRLDTHSVEQLRDELDVWLESRGVRRPS